MSRSITGKIFYRITVPTDQTIFLKHTRECSYTGLTTTNIWNPENNICVLPGPSLLYDIRSFAPDIVHVFYPSSVCGFLLPLTKLLGVPTYVSHHVDLVHYVGEYNPLKKTPCLGFCLRGVVDWAYSLGARLPAYCCADTNTAPSVVSLGKEFCLRTYSRSLQSSVYHPGRVVFF